MSDSNEGPAGSNEPGQSEKIETPNPLRPRRFKTSGNPHGRPKGARNRKTILKEIAFERRRVTENGKVRTHSTLDLIILRLRNLALEGKNLRAIEAYQKLEETYLPQTKEQQAACLVVPQPVSEAEYIAKMERKNEELRRRRLQTPKVDKRKS